MNISKIIAWSGGMALALTATVLAAQGFGPGMGGGPRMPGGSMMGGGHAGAQCGPGFLDLSTAQQADLKALNERHRAALEAKQKVAADAREELRKAMPDPAVSDAKVKELHLKVAEAMTAVMLERRAMQREFEVLLTPDQKAALEKQRAQGGPGRRMGRGGCGMGAPGYGAPGGF